MNETTSDGRVEFCIRVLKHTSGKSWEGWYNPQRTLWNGQTHWSKGDATLFFYDMGQQAERSWSFTKRDTKQGKVDYREGGWIPPVKDPNTGTWVPFPPSGYRKWISTPSSADYVFAYDTGITLSVVRCGETPKYPISQCYHCVFIIIIIIILLLLLLC